MINIILYFFKIEGGWDFRISDLAKNPVVNFGEVRKTQLAKSTLLTSTLGSLESFQIFDGQFRYKRESGVRKATGSYRTYLFAVKERPAFGQSCNLGSCICGEGPALGQNTLMMTMIKIKLNLWHYSSEEPRPTEAAAARWQYREPCGYHSVIPQL